MIKKTDYPHVRLPKKIDRILYILCEELKGNKFFNSIEKIGFDDSNSRTNFTFIVLDLIFKESSDELADLYLGLLQKHTKKLKNGDQSSATKQAIKFYVDLLIEKRRRGMQRN